jgi:hypothetical protein
MIVLSETLYLFINDSTTGATYEELTECIWEIVTVVITWCEAAVFEALSLERYVWTCRNI